MSAAVELVCPRDHGALDDRGGELVCGDGHRYPVADGIPLLLVEDDEPTHAACWHSLDAAGDGAPAGEGNGIDPLVQRAVAATCGNLYRHMIGNVREYPIPEIRLPAGEGRLFLEVGCNWGRWCVSAARRGYRVVGIDPSLESIVAARRVAAQLGVEATYAVGDARHLPFRDATFDVVFSYSVFQHFTREAALASFRELGRTLRRGGLALVQMANVYGLRSLWNQARERRWREPRELFDVRYWSPAELREAFAAAVGETSIHADGYLTLNPQPADLPLLPRRYRALVRGSEAVRKLSGRVPPLTAVADSLYVAARR